MTSYAIAPRFRACLHYEYLVFLNMKSGRYQVLEADQTAAVTPWLESDGEGGDAELLKDMIDAGYVVRADASAPIRHGPPQKLEISYLPHRLELPRPVTGRDVRRFLSAWTQAALIFVRIRLRLGDFNTLLQACQNRIDALGPRADGETDAEAREIQDLCAIYNHMAPYLFTRSQACLFDSLALFFFLTRHGFAPRFYVGVSHAPFDAHAWLEHGSVVLNDVSYKAPAFTPILAVEPEAPASAGAAHV